MEDSDFAAGLQGTERYDMKSRSRSPANGDSPGKNDSLHLKIEDLTCVIKTKNACLANFSKALRAEQDRALVAEKKLKDYESLRNDYDELVRLSHTKEGWLQEKIQELEQQLSSRTEAEDDCHDDWSVTVADDIENKKVETEETSERQEAVQSALNVAQRALSTAQDENKNLRGELEAAGAALQQSRENTTSTRSRMTALEHENLVLKKKLSQTDKELQEQMRDNASLQQQFDTTSHNLTKITAEKVSQDEHAAWLKELLCERERQHEEAEAHWRAAEIHKDTISKRLLQTESERDQAQGVIRCQILQLQLERARQHQLCQSRAKLEEFRHEIQQIERQHQYNDTKGDDDAMLMSTPRSTRHLASMSMPELQNHMVNLRRQLKDAKDRLEGFNADPWPVLSATPESTSQAYIDADCEEKTEVKSHDNAEIKQMQREITRRDAEVQDLRLLLSKMEVNAKELTDHLIKSKERVFLLSRDLQDANDELQKARDEQETLKTVMKQENQKLQAVMRNFQQLKTELQLLKDHGSQTPNIETSTWSPISDSPILSSPRVFHPARTPHCRRGLAKDFQHMAKDFQHMDHSCSMAQLQHESHMKSEEIMLLKWSLRELQRKLLKKDAKLEAGNQDLMLLKKSAEKKGVAIHEILATSKARMKGLGTSAEHIVPFSSHMHASRENPLHNQVPPNTRSGSPEADDQLPKETNTLRSHHFRGNSNEQWNISSSPVASPSSTWPAHHKHSNGMTWVQMHVDGMNSSRPQDLTSFGAKDEIPLSSGGRIFQSASFL